MLDCLPHLRRYVNAISHCNPLDHEDAVPIEDLTDCLGFVVLRIDFDLTRFQRACEGARQSAAGGRNDVVQGRRVGREPIRVGPVV